MITLRERILAAKFDSYSNRIHGLLEDIVEGLTHNEYFFVDSKEYDWLFETDEKGVTTNSLHYALLRNIEALFSKEEIRIEKYDYSENAKTIWILSVRI